MSIRSFAQRRHAAPDFVEEIPHQPYMTLGFLWLRTLGRHQRDEALAVGGEIQVHSQTEVRKLLSESHPRLVRHKRFPFHRVIRHHDPLVLSAVE